MGYPELLRVLGEEAAREAREIRAAAGRERERIVAEARAAAAAAREAVLACERLEGETRRRAAKESAAIERERTLLHERRRLLDGLRSELELRLRSAGGRALDARLLAEILAEAGPGPLEVEVDPGAEEGMRAALARIAPAAACRATVRAAPRARGGVLVRAGRRELDDTLGSRLERAWPALEAELAAILFAEG